MDKDVQGVANRPLSIASPRLARSLVMALEVGLVILVAYLLAKLVFAFFEDKKTNLVPMVGTPASVSEKTDFAILSSFDPFFRQISNRTTALTSEAIRESSLKIDVFGLRAAGEGKGSAIIKMQNSDQKLVHVGEQLSSGVELVGVYVDRLEINRSGVREAVYLRPQSARAQTLRPTAVPATRQASASTSTALDQLLALELTPVRRNSRIIGFRLPESLPAAFQLAGFEAEDILLSVNGSSLASHERMQEVTEELAGSSSLNFEIERRGEKRHLSIDLRGTR